MMRRLLRGIIHVLILLENWLTRVGVDSIIRFSSVHGAYHVSNPVEAARKIVPKWFEDQLRKAKAEKSAVKFVRCPGMHDYLQSGFIVRAHTDIHIKANLAGIVVTAPKDGNPILQPTQMDYSVVEGLAPIGDDVMKAVLKVPIPYGLFMEPGYSAYVLPALMHSPFLDKLFVYPGVVDYDKGFSTCNFIASPLHACELIIPAGTPLLQVIPFKLVNYHAVCGAASQREIDCNRFGFPSRVLGYYRKMFHQKKIYTSEVSK